MFSHLVELNARNYFIATSKRDVNPTLSVAVESLSRRLIGARFLSQFHTRAFCSSIPCRGFLISNALQRSEVKTGKYSKGGFKPPLKSNSSAICGNSTKNPERSQSCNSMVCLTALTFGFMLRSIQCHLMMFPNSVEFDIPESQPCSTTTCGSPSQEPLSSSVRSLRSSTCMASSVDTIRPAAVRNPPNVRNVELILTEQIFEEIFPKRNAAYTYTNFLKAIGKFPSVCASATTCPRILAALLAHIQQETGGLVYTEEIQKRDYCAAWTPWVADAYPCAQGKQYYGRGAMQLSWNYNYGAFSRAMLGDANVLLENPELVANTWLNFASAIWFFVTPQPPKPSMLQVLDGSWMPNQSDSASGLKPGFGASTMVINGGVECGPSPSNPSGAAKRARYYKGFAKRLGLDVFREKLDCKESRSFPSSGSAGKLGLHWSPETGCTLVSWQTAFSALVEGDYQACRQGKQIECKPSTTNVPPTQRPTKRPTQRPTLRPTQRPTSGTSNCWKRVCKKTLKGKTTRKVCTFVRG